MDIFTFAFVASHSLQAVSLSIGTLVGAVGVTIILVGCIRAFLHFLQKYLGYDILLADIRIELGHYLALGLEFLVGKDIIETVIDPTWDDLGKLPVIVALRTALTIFLAHEVKEVREELEQEEAIRKIRKTFKHK